MSTERIEGACALFKDRCATLVDLAHWLTLLAQGGQASQEDRSAHLSPAIAPVLVQLGQALSECDWNRVAIAAVIKQVIAQANLKMPQLAMPVRVLLLGTAQTPSLDAVIELMDRQTVLDRLKNPAGL